MGRRRTRLLAAGAVRMAAVVGVWSSQASAHVTIDTLGSVSQGSFAKIGFSVPTERDDAGTVKLSVQLPEDHPLAFVSVLAPMPGWDIETTSADVGRAVGRRRRARSPRSWTRSPGRPRATRRSRRESSICSGSRPVRCRPMSPSWPSRRCRPTPAGEEVDLDRSNRPRVGPSPTPRCRLCSWSQATGPRRLRRQRPSTKDDDGARHARDRGARRRGARPGRRRIGAGPDTPKQPHPDDLTVAPLAAGHLGFESVQVSSSRGVGQVVVVNDDGCPTAWHEFVHIGRPSVSVPGPPGGLESTVDFCCALR